MKDVSKLRRYLSCIIFIRADLYPSKNSFLVRKRILHSGYQILREVIDIKDSTNPIKYEFVCNFMDWESVILFKKKRGKF